MKPDPSMCDTGLPLDFELANKFSNVQGAEMALP